MIRVTEDIVLSDEEVKERFVRAIGARDQNVRKEATAVELRFDIAGSRLPADVKARLMRLGGRTVTSDGVLLIVSRALRSQLANREAARARFVALVQRAARQPKIRRPTGPSRGVREERLAAKHRHSGIKQLRRRPGSVIP
jgi:ribosome-associated protein